MSFETDLQKVRNEGRGLDWFGFLKLDADKAIKKFVRSNWEKFGWKWAARNCRDYRRLLACLCDTINFPEPQELFYSVSQKWPEIRTEVYKRSLGFGHCRFCITLSWPFVVYYRSVADIVADEATTSTDVENMVAQLQAKIYCKEFAFEKEFSFEFSQCEKSAKWTMNSVFLPFLNARFYEIAQAMRNTPKDLQEFRAEN